MFSAFTYIIIVHCQTRFDLLFSIIVNCVTYSVLHENLTCSISTRLNRPGKTWIMDISGPEKSWKTTFSFRTCHACIWETLMYVPALFYLTAISVLMYAWMSFDCQSGPNISSLFMSSCTEPVRKVVHLLDYMSQNIMCRSCLSPPFYLFKTWRQLTCQKQ